MAVVSFTLNGSDVTVGDHPHLLSALREELDVTSPKDGCSPSGQCGCCTVLVDGKAMIACSLGLDRVAGKSVTTLEGVDEGERERYARAFASTGALQCGFCTPGIVMRAKALVDKDGANLTRDKAARHLVARGQGLDGVEDRVVAGAPAQVREQPPLRSASAGGQPHDDARRAEPALAAAGGAQRRRPAVGPGHRRGRGDRPPGDSADRGDARDTRLAVDEDRAAAALALGAAAVLRRAHAEALAQDVEERAAVVEHLDAPAVEGERGQIS